MSNENNDNKPVIFNTPAGFNYEETFAGVSIKFKPKVEFLIHQINYYEYKGGYQINFKNHLWFLGIKSTELSMMLCKLVECGLIRLTANFNPGNTSNTYRMVAPFNVELPGVQKSFYYPQEITFVRKWVQDGYIVKNASTTNFVKELKPTVNAATIALQQKQINDLQAQVSSLLAQINPEFKIQSNVLNTTFMVEDKPDDLSLSDKKSLETEPTTTESISEVTSCEIFKSDLQDAKLIPIYINDELSELESMFGEEQLDVNNLQVIKDVTYEQLLDKPTHTQPSEASAVINTTLDKETFRGNLTIHYVDDNLLIQQGDSWCAIINYDDMKPWCEKLPEFEKQRLYQYVISSTEKEIRFPLNNHTKAVFNRQMMDGDVLFTYKSLSA